MIWIPLQKLMGFSPFKNVVWITLDSPITKQEVAESIKLKRFNKNYLDPAYLVPRQSHIDRVAHLVMAGWKDAIQLDVGVPELGCYVNWVITDGHHRLAAAIYRGDKQIFANISGSLDYAVERGFLNSVEQYDEALKKMDETSLSSGAGEV